MAGFEKILQTDWNLFLKLSLPLVLPIAGALILILVSAFHRTYLKTIGFWIALLSLNAAFIFAVANWLQAPPFVLMRVGFDRVSYAFDMIFFTAGILSLFLSHDYLEQEKIPAGEYYALILMAISGAGFLVHGADLIVAFLGLEVMSIAAYVLAGTKQGMIRSAEASLKYFILGAFASGFLLYGIALLYGAIGSTAYADLQTVSIPPASPLLLFGGIACVLVGVCFKIGAVPFHAWSPDVYEGSPTSVTAFMASVVKAAGFAFLVRLVLVFGHIAEIPWTTALWWIAALTMTVGNLVALKQTNIKRLLAYSSIAHAGYLLVGIVASLQKSSLTDSPIAGILFYLLAYSLATIGAFGVVIALGRRGEEAEEITDLTGLASRHPIMSFCLTVFLFSMTGFPLTAGFVGKFFLFSSAIEAGAYSLVVIGVLNSAVSAYYYLGPVVKMYFGAAREESLPEMSYSLLIGIFVCVFIVLYLGLQPSEVFLMAKESVRELVF